MRIEKTVLVEFDESAERQRIVKAFADSPATQARLLAVLEPFVKGHWSEALLHAKELQAGHNKHEMEYLHPVVYDILKELNLRLVIQEDLRTLSTHVRRGLRQFDNDTARRMHDLAGLPTREEDAGNYPAYRITN